MDETVNTCSWYDPSCALAWIQSELHAFFVWIWDAILSGAATIFELIPMPEFLQNLEVYTLPSSIAWFASAFELQTGITIIVSAYTARFILRRIPVIG